MIGCFFSELFSDRCVATHEKVNTSYANLCLCEQSYPKGVVGKGLQGKDIHRWNAAMKRGYTGLLS